MNKIIIIAALHYGTAFELAKVGILKDSLIMLPTFWNSFYVANMPIMP